jgi:hypothetical protein
VSVPGFGEVVRRSETKCRKTRACCAVRELAGVVFRAGKQPKPARARERNSGGRGPAPQERLNTPCCGACISRRSGAGGTPSGGGRGRVVASLLKRKKPVSWRGLTWFSPAGRNRFVNGRSRRGRKGCVVANLSKRGFDLLFGE